MAQLFENLSTFIKENGWTYLYFISIVTFTVFALVRGLYKIKKAEKKRLLSARNMDVTEAVETEAPDEDAENITRRRAITSIEARFDFIRKSYVPFVLFVSLVLIAIPLLPEVSNTYITLIAGIITVLLGIAGRPVIENAISGIVITMSQPIRINDTVIIDGQYGTIEKINLLYTVIKVWNWRRFVIPNHKLLQKEFENLSQIEENEWAYIEFYVSPDADIEEVKKIAKKSMKCKFLDPVEPPSFWVMDLQKDAIKCWVAGWSTNPAEAWALKSIARRNLARELQQAGIKFQSIQNQVNLNKET